MLESGCGKSIDGVDGSKDGIYPILVGQMSMC
jgi:hypothetical protein